MTDFETRTADWLSLSEALDRILSIAEPLPSEELELLASLGRALAEDVDAPLSLPRHDNSAMDGYAVLGDDIRDASSDEPVTLEVVGSSRADDAPGPPLEPGQARRIMTGAPIPPGADTVVRVEDTDAESTPGLVRIFSADDTGRHIRPAGEDMAAGKRVLKRGTTIGAGQIGVLASLGRQRVSVHRTPTVAILANGDELVPVERFQEVLDGRGVTESNSVTLAAAVVECGGTPLLLGIARDTRESIVERLRAAHRADLLVTCGGASMGEKDLLKRVLEEEGLEVDFWRVRIRPGSPMSLGFLPVNGSSRRIPIFGLPGNPASAFVTFQVFVRPFILALAGHRRIHRPVITARCGEAITTAEHLTQFQRVRLEEGEGGQVAFLTGPQNSGLVRSLGEADALAIVPEGVETLEAGEPVRVILVQAGAIPGPSRSL